MVTSTLQYDKLDNKPEHLGMSQTAMDVDVHSLEHNSRVFS